MGDLYKNKYLTAISVGTVIPAFVGMTVTTRIGNIGLIT
jgi:hypothetical protein